MGKDFEKELKKCSEILSQNIMERRGWTVHTDKNQLRACKILLSFSASWDRLIR